jgi:hypothetical protein
VPPDLGRRRSLLTAALGFARYGEDVLELIARSISEVASDCAMATA